MLLLTPNLWRYGGYGEQPLWVEPQRHLQLHGHERHTLAFGDYAPTGTGNVDQTGTFTVACTKGTGATVGLGDGDNFLSGARRMKNGSEFLTYELYKGSARTNVWGNAGGALVTLATATSNAAQTLTVYGRTPPGQDVGVGSFGDSVQITVTY